MSFRSTCAAITLLTAFGVFTSKTAEAQRVLGVTLRDYHGRGALVTKVQANTAAQRMLCPKCSQFHRITAGVNVITAVNGRSVRNTAEAVKAISSSPANAKITILNLSRGSETTYSTTLQATRRRFFGRSPRANINRARNNWSEEQPDGFDSFDDLFGTDDTDDNTDPFGSDFDAGSFHLQQERWMRNRGWSRHPDFAPVR